LEAIRLKKYVVYAQRLAMTAPTNAKNMRPSIVKNALMPAGSAQCFATICEAVE